MNRWRCRLSGNDHARNEAPAREHPKTAAVVERRLTETVDGWLATLFDPDQIDSTIRALIGAASEPDPAIVARVERAKAKVEDCNIQLARYRATLDAGGDPTLVGQWIAVVSG